MSVKCKCGKEIEINISPRQGEYVKCPNTECGSIIHIKVNGNGRRKISFPHLVPPGAKILEVEEEVNLS
jgi:hypothetical protein